jgi:hypothetical protein
MVRWPGQLVSRPWIGLGTLAVLVSLLGMSIWIVQLNAQLNNQRIAAGDASRWADDTDTTAATIPFSSPETLQIAVDPAFSAYYQSHAGATLLGAPVTPGFPIAQGWIQFFTANALLLPGIPGAATTRTSQADKQIERLIPDGLKDSHTGVIQLPLLHTLLTVGSQAHVGGSLTYTDLRSATNPDQMIPEPAPNSAVNQNSPQSESSGGVFIQGGTRDGRKVGHVIPAALWAFITRRNVSPDGWQTDFGAPLTEAIPFATTQYGASHRLLIQVFWRRALIMNLDNKDASGQPLIQPLDTGVAYLRTLTPPAPALGTHTTIWANGDIDILNAPATGAATLHVGQHFPLTLAGDTRWNGGTLWYHVKWKGVKTSGDGWAPAIGTTFTSPGKTSAWASFDLLSSGLAQYLASQGDHTAAAVYDLTRQQYYTYHLNNHYLMGNSVKVPILLAFLTMTEQQDRRPSAHEMDLLTKLIKNADDEAGEELYGEIGWGIGLKEYLDQIGITGLEPDNCEWTYSFVKPLAMVQLLTLLYEGKVLTQQDRALAFSLLENIEPAQQIGVGDTRPQGAAVAMKDGWVVGTDNRWAMNTSGIVRVGSETYIISVYSAHLNSLQEGQAIARQVCQEVASLLSQQI